MQRNTVNGASINTGVKQCPRHVTKQKEHSMMQCLRYTIIEVKKLYAYIFLYMHRHPWKDPRLVRTIVSGKGDHVALGKGREIIIFHRISSYKTFKIFYYACIVTFPQYITKTILNPMICH